MDCKIIFFRPYLLKFGHLFLREHGEDAGSAAFSLATATAACSGGARVLRCACRSWCFLFNWRWFGFRCWRLLLLLSLLLLFLIRLGYKISQYFLTFFKSFSSLLERTVTNYKRYLMVLFY